MIEFYLRRILSDNDMNQIELSRQASVRAATVNKYYHSKSKMVSLRHLSRFCAVLDCEIGDLMGYAVAEEEDNEKN